MYKRIILVSWLLTFVFLGYNLYLWGGLSVTPTIGEQLRFQAPRESSFLVAMYLSAGRQTVDMGGMASGARDFARRQFGDEFEAATREPALAIERLKSAQSWFGRLSFYGAPLLLVLSIVLYRFRAKPIRSLGG